MTAVIYEYRYFVDLLTGNEYISYDNAVYSCFSKGPFGKKKRETESRTDCDLGVCR
jgi:hypothetical protein